MFASQPRGYFASYKFNPLQQGGSYSSQPDGADGIDTYLLNTSPTTNNGTAVVMWVGESNNATDKVARSLIKFDLSSIPSNATITSATLSLWTDADFSDNDRMIRVYRLKVPFNETQATWNEASSGVSWQSPGASGTNDRESTAIGSVQILANESLDVEKQISLSTTQIQEMVNGTFTNNGFIIIADTEQDDRFNYRTSDASAATKRPKLVIEYTTSSATNTPTNTPTPGPSPTPSVTPTATATNPPPANFDNATFVYDGDGKRVKSIFNGTTTTYFVGSHYEVTGSTITKYYYAGSQRIAMRTNGTLNYLLGDHLGSTSLTTDAGGNVVSEVRYKAWGEIRYASGNTITNYTFTGQFSYVNDFGLMFYNARWLDVSLGRFAQADTIIPAGVQGLDRYAYANNSPIMYTDPSGHKCVGDADECAPTPKPFKPLVIFENDDGEVWGDEEKETIEQMVGLAAGAYAGEINSFNWMLWKTGDISSFDPVTARQAFLAVHGGSVTFRRVSQEDNAAAYTHFKNEIWVFSSTSKTYIPRYPGLVLHELGHAFNNATNKQAQNVPGDLLRDYDTNGVIDHGTEENFYYGYAGDWEVWQYGFQSSLPGSEEFADMFLGWVTGSWNSGGLGPQRSNFMNSVMSTYLSSFVP
jgi:RHS repeat-associated protein